MNLRGVSALLFFHLLCQFAGTEPLNEYDDSQGLNAANGFGGRDGSDARAAQHTWAVLIAGTNGWNFYRHQSNACHAYQILRDRYKVKQEKIITMIYDDVANDIRNPHQGTLINEPNGPNVYEGVVKDYTGNTLSVSTLYKILKGDKNGLKGVGSEKHIIPDKNNRIFIFFTGTGGKGGFSRLIADTIWADDFGKVIASLKKEKKMKEALIFWESSHAGWMFEYTLPLRSSALAMTSTASSEDSFGWYCNVNNLSVCLAGHFSISWLKAAEKNTKALVFDLFNSVRLAVNTSHPNLYGNYKLGNRKLAYFFGGNSRIAEGPLGSESVEDSENSIAPRQQQLSPNFQDEKSVKVVAERDIPILMLENEVKNAKTEDEKNLRLQELQKLKKNREFMEGTVEAILEEVRLQGKDLPATIDPRTSEQERLCFKNIANQFQTMCFDNSNYYVDHVLPKLFTLCLADAKEIGIEVMKRLCTTQHQSVQNTY